MKTAELTGNALDWAVAKCEGKKVTVLDFDELGFVCVQEEPDAFMNNSKCYAPTLYWAQGGPIIERENINWEFIGRPNCIVYQARLWEFNFQYDYYMHDYKQIGSTPLIAAMRCYVASKLGDEVEMPEELL